MNDMTKLHCPECNMLFGTLNTFSAHFRSEHAVALSRCQKFHFICMQGGCKRSFQRFTSFRRHLRLQHNVKNNRLDNSTETDSLHEIDRTKTDSMYEIDRDVAKHLTFFNEEYEAQEHDALEKDPYILDFKTTLSFAITKLVAHMRAHSSITGAALSRCLSGTENLFGDVFDLLKVELCEFAKVKGLTEDDDFKKLLSKLHIDNLFENLHTIDGQIRAIKMFYKFIDPIEIPLGYRIDQRKNSCTKDWELKQVLETFQYVSIINTLRLIMSHTHIRNLIEHESSSQNDLICNFRDGHRFKSNRYFQKYPQALRIQLYYDEIVINNPLGSKVHAHKLGTFYFSVQNLPLHFNFFQRSIHVLIICHSGDIEKYGMNKILLPFIEDMKRLESDEGVLCNYEGNPYVLRATLATVCADTLAAHQLFGLLGPKANSFCRMCMIKRSDLLNDSHGPFVQRSRTLHSEHLNLIRTGDEEMRTLTGVRQDSILHELQFHFTENFVLDILHDVLEGVDEITLFLVMKHMTTEKCYKLSCETLNSRIYLFQYGTPDIKNKPSANITAQILNKQGHKLPQKGVQIWLLMRAFPFLVSDKVAGEDEYLDLILILNRINEILFAFKLKQSILAYLYDLTLEFYNLFRKLFPYINPYNKMHHLLHYAECILQTGPARLTSCLRYEMFHAFLKQHGSKCCNYKNISKTVIKPCQVYQSAWWGMEHLPLKKIHCTNGKNTLVKDVQSRKFLVTMGLKLDDMVFMSHCVKVWGTVYNTKLLVAIDSGINSNEGNPVFGSIQEIIVLQNDEVYLLCIEWVVLWLESSLNAYYVIEGSNQRFVNINDLCDTKPFAIWNDYKSNNTYVVLRHVLL